MRSVKMMGSKVWKLLQFLLLTGVLFPEFLPGSPSASTSASSTYNFIANQRPRFKIPRGNLAYYRNPHWEILYFLKFGTFPIYTDTSSYLNRTEYLDRLRQIKNVLDESSRESDIALNHKIKQIHPNGGHEELEYPLSLDLAEAEVGLDSPFPEELAKKKKLFQAAAAEVYKNNQKHQRPLHFKSTNLNNRLGAAKKRSGSGGLEAEGGDESLVDYFLVDNDPSWIRNRVPKQAGGSEFVGGGGAGSGLFSDSEGDGSAGGLAAEMIDRKVNRKFQTQGWK